MSEFQVGDRVKDVSGILHGHDALGTVIEIKENPNADYDGQHEYNVRVAYDSDTPDTTPQWWPETDYRHLRPEEDPKAVNVALEETKAIREDLDAQRVWPRKALLDEASALITGDRNAQYGDPLQDFRRSAQILNAMGYQNTLNGGTRELTGHDIALIIAAVKMSRISWAPWKRDSWVDLAGYAACGWENVEGQMREDSTP